MKIIAKPHSSEFQKNEPLFGDLIPGDGLLLNHLAANIQQTKSFVLSLPADKLLYRYVRDKWTIKEVIMHMIEMERIYSYRMLRFARNDRTILPGFKANDYILYSGANDRDVISLLEEFEAVRNSTIQLLGGLPEEAFLRSGIMNGHPVTVRALAYHIAGHELHHINIIKERYAIK